MAVATVCFNDLPEEIVEYIFLCLSPYGEIQTCRSVCKSWHRLADGALDRLLKVFHRCQSFDWFLLAPPDNLGYSLSIAERYSHAACYHPGTSSQSASVYIFGGCTAAYTTFNDLSRFDLSRRTWIRPMPMGTY